MEAVEHSMRKRGFGEGGCYISSLTGGRCGYVNEDGDDDSEVRHDVFEVSSRRDAWDA